MPAGRPHRLADPEFAKNVAAGFVEGLSRDEMQEMFGVKDPATITRWRRDPRVKVHAMKMVEDRVLEVTRKTDAIIAGRLQHASKLSIKELLAIRKEFLGGALRAQTENADSDTIEEAQEFVEQHPDFAEAMDEFLKDGGNKAFAE